MKGLFFLAAALLLQAGPAGALVDIRGAEGGVEVYMPGVEVWKAVNKIPWGLRVGDKVRLKHLSRMRMTFDDGSSIRFSNDASFNLVSDDEHGATIELLSGTVVAKVQHYRDHIFVIRTPTARCTLRGDKVLLALDPKGVTTVEVWSGLAFVETPKGESQQVPEGSRIVVIPGKPLGVPADLKEYRTLQKLTGSVRVPAGSERKLDRRDDGASPAIGHAAPAPKGTPPELGADSLGLPPEPKPPAAPPLGPDSLNLDPPLGLKSLGIKEPKGAPPSTDPKLGLKSLGMKDPGGEKPAPKEGGENGAKKTRAAKAKAPPSPPISTDLQPPLEYKTFGVKPPPPPQPAKKAKKSPASKKKARKAAPRDEGPSLIKDSLPDLPH